ncbi:MAG TPA: vWA domain-containing protein [Polyangiaceae bacterium]|nr:vWA domain-containing protein [Polyangiaceae bacterium]
MRRSPLISSLVCAIWIFAATTRAAPAPRIEVAFAMDATGSMGPYIEQARARIGQIAHSLAEGEPKPDVRFALVTFRDKGDEFVTRVKPFTPKLEEMKAYLDAAEAGGGGDTPEAVLEGLKAALIELAWTPKPSQGDENVVRLIYLVGDAPAQHYADGPNESWLAREARSRGIVLHSIACGTDTSLEATFDALARHTEGRFFRLDASARSVAQGLAGPDSRLSGTLTDTTRAYSSSIGVDYTGSGEQVKAVPLAGIETLGDRSGLLGAHVRWARTGRVWSALWQAHVSALPAAEQPPVPAVDFSKEQVLVLGGSDAGLDLLRVERQGARRVAQVKPAASAGVRFFVVEAGKK